MRGFNFPFLLVVVGLSLPARSTIIHVPTEQPTILDGIMASSPGDTVLVQPGDYAESVDFGGRQLTLGSLYLTTGDTSYVSQTVISGGPVIGISTLVFQSGEGPGSIVRGFEIRGAEEVEVGGGLYLSGASPTLSHCRITGNSWAGAYLQDASPAISDCEISTNNGYGILVAGFSEAVFADCRIESNGSYGIILDDPAPHPQVVDCDFVSNGCPVSAYSGQMGGFSGNSYSGHTNEFFHIWGGTVTRDSFWENAGILYVMAGETYVQGQYGADGVTTLELAAGITLEISSQAGIIVGDDDNPDLPGGLLALGTEEASILFTTVSENPGTWDGIYFAQHAVDSLLRLQWCIVEYAGYSSWEPVYCNGSSPTLKNVEIRQGGGAGVYCAAGAAPELDSCRIHHQTSIGLYCNNSTVTLNYCSIYENADRGLVLNGCSTPVEVGNCTFYGTVYNVYSQSSVCTVSNSVFWNSSGLVSDGGLSVDYSDVEGGWPGTGNIDADPQFRDAASGDFRLCYNSPCIDSGDPGSPLDPDGSPADMGAFFYDHREGSPVISAVSDVPEDQGRQVIVTWQRSPLDFAGSDMPVTGYNLWEMYPFPLRDRVVTQNLREALVDPGRDYLRDDTTWVLITYLAAMQWDEYSVLAGTFRDSSGVEDNISLFFVSAHTATPPWYYVSELAGGYSVDNIAPDAVQELSIAREGGELLLSWEAITEGSHQGNSYPELNGVWYRIHSSEEPYFSCGAENLLDTVEETFFTYAPEPGERRFFRAVVSDQQ